MKRIRTLVLLALASGVLTGCSTNQSTRIPVGEVVSCSSIKSAGDAKGPLLPCLDGGAPIYAGAIKGPLILNVWGSWCGPCKEEIPILRDFYQRNKSKIAILGVDVEEARTADGKNFVVAQGMTWPNLIDMDGRSRAFFGMGVPVTWFIDSEGLVVHKKIGVLKDRNELSNLTAQYLHINVS